MKLVAVFVFLFIVGCSGIVGPGDAGEVLDVTQMGDTVDVAGDAIATDAGPSRYGTCSGFDTSTCSPAPFGSQILCAQNRCLIACGGGLVCPAEDGTRCQTIGAYEACQ